MDGVDILTAVVATLRQGVEPPDLPGGMPSRMKGLLLEGYKKPGSREETRAEHHEDPPSTHQDEIASTSHEESPYTYHEDIPTPTVEPGMLLIRVKVAGFCHTDLMVVAGEYPVTLPIIPGHENVGVIAAVAEGVSSFNVGDRVGTLLFRGACGKCRECVRHTPSYCSHTQLAGLTSHGGLSQYLLADPQFTIHLPDTMSFVKAVPLMCAGATAWNSLLRCGVGGNDRGKGDEGTRGLVGIVGIGGVGHLAVQFAKAMGYAVIAIDTRSAPLELCKEGMPEHLQPDFCINSKEMSVQEMLGLIAGRFEEVVYSPVPNSKGNATPNPENNTPTATGLDAVLICTDAIQGFATGMELLAKHGTLVYVGQPQKPVPMHWSAFVTRDIKVVGGCLPDGRWSATGLGESGEMEGRKWMTATDMIRDMIELVERVGVRVEVKEYKLRDFGRILRDFMGDERKGKIVLRIEEGWGVLGSPLKPVSTKEIQEVSLRIYSTPTREPMPRTKTNGTRYALPTAVSNGYEHAFRVETTTYQTEYI